MRHWIDMMEQANTLVSVETIKTPHILDGIAYAAQRVYDCWEQDEDGYSEENGAGGICHLIADEVINIVGEAGGEAYSVSATDEVHVYCVAAFKEGVFTVDIPYRVYEIGGGYTWKKIPNVIITADDVVIYRIDSNPDNLQMYVEDDIE